MVSKTEVVKEIAESEGRRRELCAGLGDEQAKAYDRDSTGLREFYNRFITTFPNASAAYAYLSVRWRVPLLTRLDQQRDIGIAVIELAKSAPPLMRWYLQLTRYRDLVEQIIDWLRPLTERFDLLDGKRKVPRAYEELACRWRSEPPPPASYVVDRLKKLSKGLLEGLLGEIRLDARNAFSHIDYVIDLERRRLRFFSPGGGTDEWTPEELSTQCSTMWVYLRMLAIEWSLTWAPSLLTDARTQSAGFG